MYYYFYFLFIIIIIYLLYCHDKKKSFAKWTNIYFFQNGQTAYSHKHQFRSIIYLLRGEKWFVLLHCISKICGQTQM
jgi:hypothetical protein